MSTKKRRFTPAAVATPPNADEVIPDVSTPRRIDARKKPSSGRRTAFTWRLTPEEVRRHDALMLRLKQDLDAGKLDKAQVLAALMDLAADNRAVYGALLARLQDV